MIEECKYCNGNSKPIIQAYGSLSDNSNSTISTFMIYNEMYISDDSNEYKEASRIINFCCMCGRPLSEVEKMIDKILRDD